MMPRLLQSRISPLSHQRTECLVEVIGKFVPGMRDIGFSLSSKEPRDRVFEDSEHLIPMCVLTDNIVPRSHASLAIQICQLERTLA